MGALLRSFVVLLLVVVAVEARSWSPLYGTNAGVGFNDTSSSSAIKTLTGIRVRYGWVIDGIQGQYTTGSSSTWMPNHGTTTQFTEIQVAYPSERFVRATGKYGPYRSEKNQGVTVTELSFVTYNNITGKSVTYGPYGGHGMSGQTSFQTADASEIVGLYGFTSDYMRGIGFALERTKN
ncbi:uncharacterized protein LOC112340727 [Selaginella moellendorffii]|uniref:uncharacterized protein LOC112340727 n=1 Tax=Selaginella moellendorffii TaxID=88036 RepID=UPI000D1CBE5A|nr:uncharacterized protein LOC112340727 [Selaginella moellendorffii]|eukprot:XP_024515418.1 uncharacterized protein LOC112340727 [Selaginella moellendorffii]